jgi:phytanoyl-CoA hydroxylase
MSFIPGSNRRDELVSQDLADSRSLFGIAPDLEFEPQVTLSLRAGDATFHNGRAAHIANANLRDDWRIAHVTIYMQADVIYSGRPHQVTELEPGDGLDGVWFPRPAG